MRLRPYGFATGSSVPFQEIRAYIRRPLDRIEVAIDAVGEQRVARDDGVFAWLDRVEADHRGLLAAVPLEGRGALRPLAGRHGFGEDGAFDKGLCGLKLSQRLPVHVEGAGQACDQQNDESDHDALKIHLLPAPSNKLWSMIRKSVKRFSEKIMLKRQPKAR